MAAQRSARHGLRVSTLPATTKTSFKAVADNKNMGLTWTRAFKGLALISGATVIVLSAFLLIIGVRVNVASIDGASGSSPQVQWSAAIPLVAALLSVAGVVRTKHGWAIGGALAVLLYGLLFVFSAGLYYAPLGLMMAVSVFLYRRAARPTGPST